MRNSSLNDCRLRGGSAKRMRPFSLKPNGRILLKWERWKGRMAGSQQIIFPSKQLLKPLREVFSGF